MPVTLVNPEELIAPVGYAHVAVATGSKSVHLAGQVPEDRDGNLVGAGDLARQTEQAVENVITALAGAGATYDNVVDVKIYVRDWEESKMEQLVAGFRKAAGRHGVSAVRPSTLIGVATLSRPEWLIELSVTAVID